MCMETLKAKGNLNVHSVGGCVNCYSSFDELLVKASSQ